MRETRSFAVVAAVLTLLVAATSNAAPQAAAPGATVAPSPGVVKMKAFSKLTAKNVASVPGETKSFEATLLDAKDKPLANRTVTFRIEGKNGTHVPNNVVAVGSEKTDASGNAKVSFKLPELAQGAYAIKASFAGDDDDLGSNGEANLAMFKTVTKIELGDLIWGTYKNEPGPPYGVIGITLSRTSDNASLAKNLKITVNGNTWTLYGSGGAYHQVPLPTNATTWNVSVQFEGDEANAATAAQRTYHKP